MLRFFLDIDLTVDDSQEFAEKLEAVIVEFLNTEHPENNGIQLDEL